MADEIMDVSQSCDLMLAVAEALSVPTEGRYVRRMTLVLDCVDGATVYVEEYPPGGENYVDLKSGVLTRLPRLSPKVVDGPPPAREG